MRDQAGIHPPTHPKLNELARSSNPGRSPLLPPPPTAAPSPHDEPRDPHRACCCSLRGRRSGDDEAGGWLDDGCNRGPLPPPPPSPPPLSSLGSEVTSGGGDGGGGRGGGCPCCLASLASVSAILSFAFCLAGPVGCWSGDGIPSTRIRMLGHFQLDRLMVGRCSRLSICPNASGCTSACLIMCGCVRHNPNPAYLRLKPWSKPVYPGSGLFPLPTLFRLISTCL